MSTQQQSSNTVNGNNKQGRVLRRAMKQQQHKSLVSTSSACQPTTSTNPEAAPINKRAQKLAMVEERKKQRAEKVALRQARQHARQEKKANKTINVSSVTEEKSSNNGTAVVPTNKKAQVLVMVAEKKKQHAENITLRQARQQTRCRLARHRQAVQGAKSNFMDARQAVVLARRELQQRRERLQQARVQFNQARKDLQSAKKDNQEIIKPVDDKAHNNDELNTEQVVTSPVQAKLDRQAKKAQITEERKQLRAAKLAARQTRQANKLSKKKNDVAVVKKIDDASFNVVVALPVDQAQAKINRQLKKAQMMKMTEEKKKQHAEKLALRKARQEKKAAMIAAKKANTIYNASSVAPNKDKKLNKNANLTITATEQEKLNKLKELGFIKIKLNLRVIRNNPNKNIDGIVERLTARAQRRDAKICAVAAAN